MTWHQIARSGLKFSGFAGAVLAFHQIMMCSAHAAMFVPHKTSLDYHVDIGTFVSSHDTMLLVSNIEKKLVLFDLMTSETIKQLEYSKIIPDISFDFQDVAAAPDREFAYLVGTELGDCGDGLLVRLDLKTFDTQRIALTECFDQASAAVDTNDQIFIGNLRSNKLTIVQGESFESSEGRLRTKNIYLRESPAFEVAVFERGSYVVASQGLRRKVSLIDVDTGEIVDEFAPDSKGVSAVAVETAPLPVGGGYLGSVLIGDYDADSISLLDVDPYFEVLRFAADAKLGLRKGVFREWEKPEIVPPLMVSMDREQKVIVVGRRLDTRVAVFSRAGSALERRNTVELEDPISGIDVSPDGSLLAILSAAERSSLTVIRNPGGS